MVAIRPALFCLTGLVSIIASASAAEVWYSERGVGSTGVSIAQDLVSEFHDIPKEVDFAKVGAFEGMTKGYKVRMWKKMTDGRTPGSQKNIVWRVTLPFWGQNGPVVIDEKVFLLYEEGWKAEAPMLLCLDVHTGKTLWEQPVDHLDALPAGEQTTAKKARASEQARFRLWMKLWNELYWDNKESRKRTDAERAKIFPAFQKKAEQAGYLFKNAQAAKGVSGGWRGRFGLKLDGKTQLGGAPKDPAVIANGELVRNKRWWLRQWWTTENVWYGNTHGSVISDGKTIYAVTGNGALAAFDLTGKRKWVQWINPKEVFYQKKNGAHGNLQAPVLADGKILYFHRDSARLFAFDAETGKELYVTVTPENKKAKSAVGGKKNAGKGPGKGYHNFTGHIGPGSTTLIMELDGETVAVTGVGVVVRVRDGHILGLVDSFICSYFDMAAAGYIYVFKTKDNIIRATRLGIDGDRLTQKQLWEAPMKVGNWESGSNVAIAGNRVLFKAKKDGMISLDLESGKLLKQGGPASEYFAIGDGRYVTRGGAKNRQVISCAIVGLETQKALGRSLLIEPAASGEIWDRHIAFHGTPEIRTGWCKPTVWGNRIFIRSSDYLWCIGDPAKKFSAPAPIGK